MFCYEAQSQVTPVKTSSGVTSNLVSATYGNVLDTVGSSGSTHYMVYPATFNPAGFYQTCTVQATFTNLTGTTTIAATLQHSNDGVNWYSLNSDSTYSIDGTSTVGWKFKDNSDAYIRVKAASSASGTTTVAGSYLYRKSVVINQ